MKRNLRRVMSVFLFVVIMASLSACEKTEKVSEENLSNEVQNVQEQMENIANESANVDVGEYVIPSKDLFNWEEVDGGVAIIGYTGDETTIEIPSQIGGKDVVSIKSGWFGEVALIGVKLPDTMTEIGEYAFCYCTSLKEVKFGLNVQKVDKHAFEGCLSLQNIVLNNKLEVIEQRAFCNCISLETIALASGLKEIGSGAFCLSGLKSIIIPSTVKVIGNQAFSTCQSLGNVVIEEGVSKIGEKSFEDCTMLNRIEIPKSVTEIGLRAFTLCSESLLISAPVGSVAEKYAKKEDIKFEAL